MLDGAAFGAMKRGAYLVNVARGGLIDDDALVGALDRGHLGGAVLDAFRQEPVADGHPLWGRPDVLALPHVTWSSSTHARRLQMAFRRATTDVAERGHAGGSRRPRRRLLTACVEPPPIGPTTRTT